MPGGLRLSASSAGGTGSISAHGIKIPHAKKIKKDRKLKKMALKMYVIPFSTRTQIPEWDELYGALSPAALATRTQL